MKIPGPDHPITVQPEAARVSVHAGDRVLADTTTALRLQEADYPPVFYIPIRDVDRALLRQSDTHTHCPYKGDASYYDLVTDEGTISDAVWTYDKPYDAVGQIAEHVAFYGDRVQIALG